MDTPLTAEDISPSNEMSPIFALYSRIETLEGVLSAYRALLPALVSMLSPEAKLTLGDRWSMRHADMLSALDAEGGQYVRDVRILRANQRNGLKGEWNRLQEALASLERPSK